MGTVIDYMSNRRAACIMLWKDWDLDENPKICDTRKVIFVVCESFFFYHFDPTDEKPDILNFCDSSSKDEREKCNFSTDRSF